MKHFQLKLLLLFILLLLVLFGLSSVLGKANFVFTQLVLFALAVLIIVQCFSLINTTNRQLKKFLFAIKYQDFSISFPENERGSFQDLHKGLNHSLEKLRKVKEKENRVADWAEPLFERVPVGIIVLKEHDKIEYINPVISERLNIPSLSDLSDLSNYDAELVEQMLELPPEENQSFSLKNKQEIQIYKVNVKTQSSYNLLFIQFIDDLNGSAEMDSWLKLIRVLTHEIMNSITSISSLAGTIHEEVKANKLSKDLEAAAASIKKRSQRLIQFTNSYREVSHIRAANKTWFLINELLQEMKTFLQKELSGIDLTVLSEGEQAVFADREQIEQVFINLFLNAKEALKNTDSPLIKVKITQQKSLSIIHFTDNGKGIPPEIQNQIFIPFYTTKKSGKGIGLSLCRQLMRNNNGSISLFSSESGKTIFELRLSIFS